MTREQAMEKDNELKSLLQNFAKEHDIDSEIGSFIVDNFVEFIPEDSMKGIIFLGDNPASYKAGNARIDFKKSLTNTIEYAASISKPENVIGIVQLIILTVLFVGRTVKQELNSLEAYMVYWLHMRNAYQIGVEEERFISDFQDWYHQETGKRINHQEVVESINHLYSIHVTDVNDGNIFLKENVWGNMCSELG